MRLSKKIEIKCLLFDVDCVIMKGGGGCDCLLGIDGAEEKTKCKSREA